MERNSLSEVTEPVLYNGIHSGNGTPSYPGGPDLGICSSYLSDHCNRPWNQPVVCIVI